MSYLGDLVSLTTYDGVSQFFPSGDAFMPTYGNFGSPPIEWITSRGYRQHGATVLTYTLQPRTVSIELYHRGNCSRQTYWDNRSRLINLLRPNRGGPMTLTIQTPNGSRRSLFVRPDPGLILPPGSTDRNDWSINEVLDLTAFDPIWINPDIFEETSSGSTDDNLVFPITFPIEFGLAGNRFSFVSSYDGTWESFPIITIEGPYDLATLVNHATGALIQLMIPITAGQRRIVDLTPGQQSVKDEDGTNKFGELAPLSNLVQFSIQPNSNVDPQIEAILSNTDASTSVSISYYERYFGI